MNEFKQAFFPIVFQTQLFVNAFKFNNTNLLDQKFHSAILYLNCTGVYTTSQKLFKKINK